jgi:hypothetical protein
VMRCRSCGDDMACPGVPYCCRARIAGEGWTVHPRYATGSRQRTWRPGAPSSKISCDWWRDATGEVAVHHLACQPRDGAERHRQQLFLQLVNVFDVTAHQHARAVAEDAVPQQRLHVLGLPVLVRVRIEPQPRGAPAGRPVGEVGGSDLSVCRNQRMKGTAGSAGSKARLKLLLERSDAERVVNGGEARCLVEHARPDVAVGRVDGHPVVDAKQGECRQSEQQDMHGHEPEGQTCKQVSQGAVRMTYPTPRTVWVSEAAPACSIFWRRRLTCWSMMLVCGSKW